MISFVTEHVFEKFLPYLECFVSVFGIFCFYLIGNIGKKTNGRGRDYDKLAEAEVEK